MQQAGRVVFAVSVYTCAYYRLNSIAIQMKHCIWEIMMSPPLLKASVIIEDLIVHETKGK